MTKLQQIASNILADCKSVASFDQRPRVLTLYSGEVKQSIFDLLLDFCRAAEQETKHEQHLNMRAEGWEQDPKSLLYLLMTEQRFKRGHGGLCVLLEECKITAVSGFYRSDLHPDIWVMGVRSWVLKEERFQLKVARRLLPKQLSELRRRSAKMAIITFNEQTRPFQLLIQHANDRINRGAKVIKFFGDVGNYPDLYRDMWARPSPIWLRRTKQWLLVKRLDPNFVFDFSKFEVDPDEQRPSLPNQVIEVPTQKLRGAWRDKLYGLLEEAERLGEQSNANFFVTGWRQNPGSLLKLIEQQIVASICFIVDQNGEAKGIFSYNVFGKLLFGPRRVYVAQKFKQDGLGGDVIMPFLRAKAYEHGCNYMFWFNNDTPSGRALREATLKQELRGEFWEENEVLAVNSEPKTIYGTSQWGLYVKVNPRARELTWEALTAQLEKQKDN